MGFIIKKKAWPTHSLKLKYVYIYAIFHQHLTMQSKPDIPLPVKFNACKHHLTYILKFNPLEPDVLPDNFCNNYTDLYTGFLSPATIAREVIDQLKERGLLEIRSFEKALSALSGFFILTLSDNSQWVIRKGDNLSRYIHIHPARTGNFTLRFKQSTFKTSLLLFHEYQGKTGVLTLKNVNSVRVRAGLSPISKIEKSKGIGRCYSILLNFAEE
ncbi:MAG: hypothetical protein RBS33_10515 [Lentimicrobium sp.]|nr:hypothetical protein [Lentimicrobium sp.]